MRLKPRLAVVVSGVFAMIGTGLLATVPAHAGEANERAATSVRGCTVNVYRVIHTPAAVWTWPGGKFLRDKKTGDDVRGPNSNVMDNYHNGWRIVYLGSGDLGQMWDGYLDYRRCL